MRLGNILQQKGGVPESGRPVKFQVRTKDKQGYTSRVWCEAVVFPLSEAERGEVEAAARAYCAAHPEVLLGDEAAYRKVQRFLRDPEDVRVCFFVEKELDMLRGGLVYRQVERLLSEYEKHMEEEYPEVLDAAQEEALVEEAIKN